MAKKEPYKWVQGTGIKKRGHKGALRRYLHIREGENIPLPLLKKTAHKHGIHGEQARMALTMRGFKHHRSALSKRSRVKHRHTHHGRTR